MAFRHCLDQYNTINHLYMLAQEPSQIVLESRCIASPITFEFAYLVMGRIQADSIAVQTFIISEEVVSDL